jgi:hypothetical protein
MMCMIWLRPNADTREVTVEVDGRDVAKLVIYKRNNELRLKVQGSRNFDICLEVDHGQATEQT